MTVADYHAGVVPRSDASDSASSSVHRWPTALRWVLGASIVLNLAGIWWGYPAQWVPNELIPPVVLDGLRQHFSHGWWDTYPPFHFYVLSAAMSPVLMLQALGLLRLTDVQSTVVLGLIFRLVSIAAGAGIVVATYRAGAMTFGERAGVAAAALFTLVAPFLYYGKTANTDVPYIFWWALSLVYYLRALDRPALRDYLGFAVTATLSVCTKDQAYALFLLPAAVLVTELWRLNRQSGVRRLFWHALVDRRLLWPAAVAVALFALIHNLAFNLEGFRAHVAYLIGPGSQTYRAFDPTLAGRWALLKLTVRLIVESLGWPVFIVCMAGGAIALATPRLRRPTWWLLVPVVSYYLGFINVILYNYDRFVLPICLVLAVFGGLAIDRFLGSVREQWSWRAAVTTAVFAYTLLYASSVDVLMIRDSRYEVREWLLAHTRPGDLIAKTFDDEYNPRLDGFHVQGVDDIGQLQHWQPVFFVLNADYARAVPTDSAIGALIAGLQDRTLGYRLAHRRRTLAPFPWLPFGHPDLVGPREDRAVFGILRDINPTIEVYERFTLASGAAER